jgi:glycerol uptake facilitator-like aquaporin
VTIGRTLTDTFAGIDPTSVPAFIAMQVIGALVAVGLARFLYPDQQGELVMPHEAARG